MKRVGEWLLNTALVALVATALVVGIIKVIEFVDSPQREVPRVVDDWRSFAQSGHRYGPDSPLVTIVEFADYNCAVCQQAAPHIDQILSEYESDVALVYRHFPLSQTPGGIAAIRAVDCADKQGRFWIYHRLVYAMAAELKDPTWADWAAQAGVHDIASFQRCIENNGPLPLLGRDTAAAHALGIRGTPLFLINELRIPGYPGQKRFNEYVEAALREARQ